MKSIVRAIDQRIETEIDRILDEEDLGWITISDKKVLPSSAVCSLAKCSESSLRMKISRGLISPFQFGGKNYFLKETVKKLLLLTYNVKICDVGATGVTQA